MLKRNIFYFLTFSLMIFPCFEDVLCVDYNLTADLRYRLKTDTSEDIEKDAFSSLSEMRSRIGIICSLKMYQGILFCKTQEC